MYPLVARLWVPRWGDIELYEMTHSYMDNETICDNKHDLHDHSSTCLLLPYKLSEYEKATSLNDRYHAIIDVTTKPKCICLLLALLFLRTLLRKHDYLIVEYLIMCWATLIPFVKGPSKSYSLTYQEYLIGGGVSEIFSLAQLKPYLLIDSMIIRPSAEVMYRFDSHCIATEQFKKDIDMNDLVCDIPLHEIVTNLTVPNLKLVAAVHGIFIKSRTSFAEVVNIIQNHNCEHCQKCITVFKPAKSLITRRREANVRAVRKYKTNKILLNKNIPVDTKTTEINKQLHLLYPDLEDKNKFPPSPLEQIIEHAIVKAWCKNMSPKNFEEVGCAVCGELSLRSKSVLLKNASIDLNILQCHQNITRKERKTENDLVNCLKGPVMEHSLQHMCARCFKSLTAGKVPKFSLANGMWLGQVPSELANLTFAEQLLLARVRHNRCLVRVSSGWHKMTANAISFANPTPIVYDVLPPSKDELDEILAFIYTGPCKPTPKDFERTPLLVRRNKVGNALEWLKLNHCDYYDLEISQRNLDSYPEGGPPVIVEYLSSIHNKALEATSVYDNEEEAGTSSGPCPFAVHGITGEEYSTKTLKALKAIAVGHLMKDGKILAVGHARQPESLYNNPQLYPQMMPWLFPYGLGGIGHQYQRNSHISDLMYKRHLLLYHDKRFQKDSHFPLIAFNHEQIKDTATAGYILSDRQKFDEITDRLLHINKAVLTSLCTRMAQEERIVPETQEEKNCFELLKDIDHVGRHVKGSITNKKIMRNEIWSLISFIGAPSWFITFAPADNLHPISLYWADNKEEFTPLLRDYDERYQLMSKNPVAGARFFHFLCQLFIKDVLGVGSDHQGAYGETEAYYGTVEQQGRLALHLHLLLWIKGSLSPQEIRDRIMDPESNFQKRLVEYLESVHIGEFMTGPMEKVVSDVECRIAQDSKYQDPTQTLPESPPPLCRHPLKDDCARCKKHKLWVDRFKSTVDDILLKSNVHRCGGGKNGRRPTCINKQGNCKARFPRPLFRQTEVDPLTGALNIKKGEPWLNTVTPVLTYVLRCNTDVTSLLSGTAVKAVVAYISDYVTKTALKTYTIFDSIKGVYERNSEMLSGSFARQEKARRLVTQIVNSLTAKSEIGAPMAAMYLLGNPDHYTSHDFVPFYWKSFVHHIFFHSETNNDVEDSTKGSDKVVIQKKAGKYVAYSAVFDYILRPLSYSHLSLYTWIQTSQKCKIPKNKSKTPAMVVTEPVITEDLSSDDELNIVEASLEVSNNTPLQSDSENASDGDSDDEKDELDVISAGDDNDTIQRERRSLQYYYFLDNHPQRESHYVTSNPKCLNKVPNFLGGSLPRCDRGDREYYCATMLAMFKPWRKREDLKNDNHSWDETFTNHKFTAEQSQLMRNFNIRYECNDARDDYSAQLKQQNGSCQISASWLTSDLIDNNDNIDFIDDYAEHALDHDQEEGIDQFMRLGKYGLLKQAEMDAMKHCMQAAGWLEDSPNGLDTVIDKPIEPSVVQLGLKWKAAVNDKRKEVLSERNNSNVGSALINFKTRHAVSESFVENQVKVVDRSYLSRSYEADTKLSQDHIDSVVQDRTLNQEQERAFRIIANHTTQHNPEQLKMYIGGMAGTGKSQVIKALIQFFSIQKQQHRFVILGPTGTAAALNNGSTYHSFLGMQIGASQNQKAENIAIAQLKERLQGVDYIFLDEVSMLACHELYKISSQLAKALNEHESPFGGINFIFAGDFAQLPPVGGKTLYSNVVSTQLNAGLTLRDQEAAIGKALWHQITTVVILRQNMRQRSQTPRDAQLRTALVNMRYGKCTPDDIKFLRSLVAGRRPDQPKLAKKEFRNVAVICGRHTQKDQINMIGCERFAKDTGQKLVDFYSIDQWGNSPDPAMFEAKKLNKTLKTQSVQKRKEMSLNEQTQIWSLRPGATEHFPGKLSLCLGMPVMLRNNEATELCITKGQEGFVVGWQSMIGPHDKMVLDTLFVELDKPPRLIRIPGLPDNVVPIVKDKKTIQCTFPSDDKASVERQQVWVLPNFAMTDYASQGKTRPHNVVHLNSCTSHQSYYTCLSRSASADGTIIVQGFEPRVITGGCAGYLRQEFREQEILDDITQLRYENELPHSIDGNRRNTLIRQYQKWKGTAFVPAKVDPHLSWGDCDSMPMLPVVTDSPWQLVSKTETKTKTKTNNTVQAKPTTNFVPAQGTAPILDKTESKKRRAEDEADMQPTKKVHKYSLAYKPKGFIWDGNNYSCAYDALFTVLYDIWNENRFLWNVNARYLNSKYLQSLGTDFLAASQGMKSLEIVRDDIRKILHIKDSQTYPYGHVGTSLSQLTLDIFSTDVKISKSQETCPNCNFFRPAVDDNLGCVFVMDHNASKSTSHTIDTFAYPSAEKCPECLSNMISRVYYTYFPSMLVFDHSTYTIKPSKYLKFTGPSNKMIKYHLRGLLYFGNFHFTSRVISPEGDVWYHDGMNMGSECRSQGHRKFMNNQDWQTCHGRKLVTSIYVKY